MHCYVTDEHKIRSRSTCSFQKDDAAEFNLIVCYPDTTFQRLEGFGAALTESSAYVFAQMPPQVQDDFIRMVFGGNASGCFKSSPGNAYTLARTHVQSCDFSLGTYSYVKPFDKGLRSFSIERDKRLLVPFLHCCLEANPKLQIVSTPWSPPAFMKTIPNMKRGGRLKRSYYGAWAQMLARYVQAYRAEGVPIAAMSVQNEPMAQQEWESCLFT
ncbi:MAG: hypothetical protein J5804_00375, partial [Eggerthellaceae bacterium]|nr:hypothetical protein [Eggerthellaceae bacterium]